MSSKRLTALIIAGLCSLVAATTLAQPANSVAGRLAQLEAGAAQQAAQTGALEAAVAGLQSQNAAQAEQITGLEAALAEASARVTALETALGALAVCPPGDAPICCPEGASFCGDACADLSNDAAHCGACGVACGEGQGCFDGTCRLACETAEDCGTAGDSCVDGRCGCSGDGACQDGEVCRNGCSPCGNGVVDAGEACDDGNNVDGDRCANDCTEGVCAPDHVFAVGVYGTATCAQNCASIGATCIGIGTDEVGSNGQYMGCADNEYSGVGNDPTAGTCDTVLGGNGCSEYTQCSCVPSVELQNVFAVGVYGTATCAANCASVGGACVGIGTDEDASDGNYMSCADGASSGVGNDPTPGGCGTVLGGNGCSEYAHCKCNMPNLECTEKLFAVGVYGTATCAANCAGQGLTCVGIGTDENATNGRYFDCGDANSGVGQNLVAGSCDTVLGGNGCSEYTGCRCY